jgi:Ca-activated chloride channel family protein
LADTGPAGVPSLQKTYKKAELLFHDPAFKAASYYRDHNFSEAARIYKEINTAAGEHNQGNALTMFGKYKDAVAAYRMALSRKPDFTEAKENLKVAEKLLKEKEFIERHTIAKNPDKKEQVTLSSKNRSKKEEKLLRSSSLRISLRTTPSPTTSAWSFGHRLMTSSSTRKKRGD